MKVIVKETKEVTFERFRGEAYCCTTIRYKVYVDNALVETFYSEKDVNKYIDYLRERKSDYERIITDIEI